LTTFKLDTSTWRGTHVSFLVNFQDKIREYERLTPAGDHYSDEMKRTLLMQAVSQVRELASIKTQLQLEVVQGRPMPNFAGYVGLILSTCQILDQRISKTAARAMVNKPTAITASVHDFESEYEEDHQGYYENYSHEIDSETFNIDTDATDLEIYRAQQAGAFKKIPSRFNRISLDRATWHNLPQEDKAKWDTLSPEGKNAIIAGTRQRGVEIASSSTPVKPKPKTTPTDTTPKPSSIKNTRSVSFATTEENANETESINANVTESSKNPNTEANLAHSEDQKILVNLAKSRLPASDIRMLLSQVSDSTQPQRKKGEY
jgi:hypothetical protein